MKKRLWAGALLALAAGACGPRGDSQPAPTAATPAGPAASTAAPAASSGSASGSAAATPAAGGLPDWARQTNDDQSAAEIFVRGLYSRYTDTPNPSGAERPEFRNEVVFAPALIALMAEDARLANGEVGYMDSDPICQCQDWEHLSIRSLDFAGVGPGRADAVVAFTNADRLTRLTLKLQLTPQGWRVADVLGAENEPQGLAAALTRANAEAARTAANSGSGARP